MRLLDRYQLRELAVAFAYCLAGILVFWVSFELLEEIGELRRGNVGAAGLVLYLWYRVPVQLQLQVPVALLLSMLYVLTQHMRHNELVAMRAAGLSLWRISLPYVGVGVACSLGMYALNEYAVPDAAAKANAILNEASGKDSGWRAKVNFLDSETGRIWNLDAFHVGSAELKGAHVRWVAPGGAREELIAEHGHWEDSGWVFERVTRLTFPPGADAEVLQIRTNRLVVKDFPETPAHLRSEVKISQWLGSSKKSRQIQLSLREIMTYRELHPRLSPRFDALLRTWFHDRLALPWTCLVVILIAIPAGVGTGRRNLFVGVAATVFFAFAFFVVKEFSLALGAGGYVAPWLAAWAPNLLFGGAGFVAMLRVQ